MSSPVQDDQDRRKMYAPPWARDGQERPTEAIIAAIERLREERQRVNVQPADDDGEAPARQGRSDPDQPELPLADRGKGIDIETAMADAVRSAWRPSTLEPVRMAAPPPAEGPSFGMVARLGSAVGFAAVVALIATGTLQLPAIDFLYRQDQNTGAAPALAQVFAPSERPPSAPLVVAAAAPQAAVPVAAVAVAPPVAPPPPARSQSKPLSTEILAAYASIEASAAVPPQIAPKVDIAPPAVPAPKPSETRGLERDELAVILKRGQMLLAEGDIASARLLLRRAAEAGDATAALTLAGTYDRAELVKLKVIGVAPDRAQAKHWYEKAVEHGSAEAVRRLQQFVQRAD